MNKYISDNLYEWIEYFLKISLSDSIKLEFTSTNHWVITYQSNKLILPFYDWLYSEPNLNKITYEDLSVKKYKYEKNFLIQLNLKKQEFNSTLRNYDYIGFIFWTLNLYEDKILGREKDQFFRFSAKTSLAFKNNYLQYPYIDYILEFFRDELHITEENKPFPKLYFTHDLDCPCDSLSLSNFKICLKLVLNGDLTPLLSTFRNWFYLLLNQNSTRFYMLDWLLELYIKNNIESYFFIQSLDKFKFRHRYDCEYNLFSKPLTKIIKKLSINKQNLGLHLSNLSNWNLNSINLQVDNYKKFISFLNLKNKISFLNRCHFLQFEKNDNYFKLMSNENLNEDFSIGFYDYPGFRVGTGNSYILYPLNNKITIRPLICMEVSLSSYMKLKYTKEIEKIIVCLAKRAFLSNSDFSLLWHDNNLISKTQKEIYLSIFRKLNIVYKNN